MTRLPAENRNVTGIEYSEGFPKYKVGPLCSAPGCSRLADHAHHIWRRSFLAGDYGWVKLWNDTIVQNLCALCHMHHQLVTENEVIIVYQSEKFWWNDGKQAFALDPQPKVWGAPSHVTELPEKDDQHVHAPGSVEKCPTCRRSLPRPAARSEAKRPRRDWKVTVPVDERENGADVLDTLIEEAQKILGHDETKQARYFTLAQVLALFLQDYGS